MMRLLLLSCLLSTALGSVKAQADFPYRLLLLEKPIVGLPGLHSYAYGQLGSNTFFFGGRTNGIHARQPFRAIPPAAANERLYCLDWLTDSAYSVALDVLPQAVREQLSASNFNFHQSGQHLIISGGYGFSESRQQFITYPQLLRIDLHKLKENLQQQTSIASAFELLVDTFFAVTGGQLGKIGADYYLAAGHLFNGRYNPMGPNHGPGFEQRYTNQIRVFQLSPSNEPLQHTVGKAFTHPIELHRRDYNLVPQLFENEQFGYTLFSGVFQHTADLPYLHPIDVLPGKMRTYPYFLQHLSHYHSARVPLYDRSTGAMHNLFFGGISRFYPGTDGLKSDSDVPFVHTISRVTREGHIHSEYLHPERMPALLGASAEFILQSGLPLLHNEIISLADISSDSLLLGHIVGGIQSELPNAFATNQTEKTGASAMVYALYLVRDSSAEAQLLPRTQLPLPDAFSLVKHKRHGVQITFPVAVTDSSLHYLVSTPAGELLEKGQLNELEPGEQRVAFDLRKYPKAQKMHFTIVYNHSFFMTLPFDPVLEKR
jgi:hypothetical protein